MVLHPLPDAETFDDFSLLCLNAAGRYVVPGNDLDSFEDGQQVLPAQLPAYLGSQVWLPDGVTDVFVWVHGWQNKHAWALANTRRLFQAIRQVHATRAAAYPRLSPFVPGFVMVRWPSLSSPLPSGYCEIRDRAAALTEDGDAEFFLASLLGYLDQQNRRVGGLGSRTLAAKGGFFIHCVGHSFGGRFLTAAIRAAAEPQARTLSLLSHVSPAGQKVLAVTPAVNGFQFTVDSMLVFQMAAPRHTFGPRWQDLIDKGPLRGPVVLTYSSHDRANCTWHRLAEGGEVAIGCSGAGEPRQEIGEIRFGELNDTYAPRDFGTRIVNVDASSAFANAGLRPEGAHSDFWYEESVHLLLSLADFVHV